MDRTREIPAGSLIEISDSGYSAVIEVLQDITNPQAAYILDVVRYGPEPPASGDSQQEEVGDNFTGDVVEGNAGDWDDANSGHEEEDESDEEMPEQQDDLRPAPVEGNEEANDGVEEMIEDNEDNTATPTAPANNTGSRSCDFCFKKKKGCSYMVDGNRPCQLCTKHGRTAAQCVTNRPVGRNTGGSNSRRGSGGGAGGRGGSRAKDKGPLAPKSSGIDKLGRRGSYQLGGKYYSGNSRAVVVAGEDAEME